MFAFTMMALLGLAVLAVTAIASSYLPAAAMAVHRAVIHGPLR
ncbi:MAG: hypothetical protein ACRDP7_19745 [Trebonia sp.]